MGCAKCRHGDILNLKLTGHELNRYGYLVGIFLCLDCINKGLTDLDKQLYFKSFDVLDYVDFCSRLDIRVGFKYLKRVGAIRTVEGGFIVDTLPSGSDLWREVNNLIN